MHSYQLLGQPFKHRKTMPSATTFLPGEPELGHLCAPHVGAKSHRRHNPPGAGLASITHRKVYHNYLM